jgi:cobalt-precorrin 5A hydrolase/precorrin-3B C17-methyltransferase
MNGAPAIVVLDRGGLSTAARLRALWPTSEIHAPAAKGLTVDRTFASLGDHLAGLFADGRPIVALAAAGIVIRLLAPRLRNKPAEPPVLAVAEDGSAVVPLLGGHRGANRLAREAADALGCNAAITTASEIRFGVAVDDPPEGWRVANPKAAKAVQSALLAGETVGIEGSAPWLEAAVPGLVPGPGRPGILVTTAAPASDEERLVLHPQLLALGVGCERGVPADTLVAHVEAILRTNGLARPAIACVVSIDLKSDEPAVHALAAHLGVPARFFPAARLEAETPRLSHPSESVFREVGCHGVAEGAALAAAGPDGRLIVPKVKGERLTAALAEAPAPIDPRSVGSARGHLAVVGVGPGAADLRTREAARAVALADDVVGYRGYLDLVTDLLAGKEVHAFALGDEVARCRAALELAAAGRRVALVSSGDPGVYAMAPLVLELMEAADDPAWRRSELTVLPGVSAMQAAAARVGAPLGHDFCAVSLSDLMTPWSVIEGRLEAAAAGDFVVALYNPASARRREGLARALTILRTARAPATPVVVARNLGRAGETVRNVTLGELDPDGIDMLTVLIVGGSATRIDPASGRVLTPRGYPMP